MSPRSKKQLDIIKEKKKKLITQTALELFAEYGYRGTSINMIAEKASIAKGLVYSYFENKEDLLKDIVKQGLDDFDAIFDPNKDGYLTEEEFEFFIDESINLLTVNTKFWRLYFVLVMKKEIIEMFDNRFKELTNSHIKLLTDYYKRKNIQNPEIFARFFVSTIDGVAFNYVINPENYPISDIKKIIIKQFK